MEKELTLGSLFDGIGGWQIAATHAGITTDKIRLFLRLVLRLVFWR